MWILHRGLHHLEEVHMHTHAHTCTHTHTHHSGRNSLPLCVIPKGSGAVSALVPKMQMCSNLPTVYVLVLLHIASLELLASISSLL